MRSAAFCGNVLCFSWWVSLGFVASAAAQQLPGRPGVEIPPSLLPQGRQFDAAHPLTVAPAAATTVQLPTFNFFTISTTVMVPDSGGAFLGGVNSAGGASRTNGGPGLSNRAGGSGLSGGGVTVTAQIQDLREMDRRLLAEAAAERKGQAAQLWAARMERAKESTAGRPTISGVEARQARAAGNVR